MSLKKSTIIWSVVCGVSVIGALIAGVWSADQHWTPREIHKITTDQIYADMSQFQKDLAEQRARDAVTYWTRIEWELQNACDRHPNDQNLQRKLQRARSERQKAEQYLREVQRRR